MLTQGHPLLLKEPRGVSVVGNRGNMSYRLASRTLAIALSSSLLLLSVGAGMSVAASPTTPVKPSIQGGGPGGGGDDDDENEGNERAENEENEGTGTGGGLVNKAKPVTKAKKPVVKPLTKASAKPKVASA